MAGTYKPSGEGTRIWLPKTVLEAALERIDRLFDEFDNVIVRTSGGKDSTVITHLALQVATARKRLPLKVFWLDQEAEWQSTVDTVRDVMYRDDVEARWLQIPFRLQNAVSKDDVWLKCWDPERKADWVHPQDPISVKANTYGTDRFHKLFPATLRAEFGDSPGCSLSGVRSEESNRRTLGLTMDVTYKGITWGKIEDKRRGQYVFYPIYDWSYTDVWKAIFDHKWPYNALYDAQYRYGMPLTKMRVSAISHETSLYSLFYLQEVEPDTYERMVKRIGGIDTTGKLGDGDYWVRELPFMFDSWRDYRDYLLEHLMDDEAKPVLRAVFAEGDRKCPEWLKQEMWRADTQAVLAHDRDATKIKNWRNRPDVWQAIKENRPNWA